MPASGGRSARSAGTVCWSTRRIVLRPGPGGHPFGHRTRTPSPRRWPGAAWSRQQGQTDQPGVAVSVRTEVSERWVRAFVDDVAVVDSRAPVLCWEEHFPVPTYAFARDDVRADLLRPSKAEPPHGPAFFLPKGPVAEWFDLEVGDRLLEHVAWRRDDPAVADLLVLSWQPGLVGRWQEEDGVVRGPPRDPHSRVDALPSSRHVQVSLDGTVLADTTGPVLLFETGLPTRFYLPADDVASARSPPRRPPATAPTRATRTGTGALPGPRTSPGRTPRRSPRWARSGTGSPSTTSCWTCGSTAGCGSGRCRRSAAGPTGRARRADAGGLTQDRGRRPIFEPSQVSGSYLRSATRSLSGMMPLSVRWMPSGHTSEQHLVMLQ